MKNYHLLKNKKTQKGYAILFAVVIVSAISVITVGLSNIAYKQLILSSLAKDSQLAFYQADTAGDCALYADRVVSVETPNILNTPGPWVCSNANLQVTPAGDGSGGYDLLPQNETSMGPCFRINVIKDIISAPPLIKTKIFAKGYNICDINNMRTVERKVEINYEE
jgi:hypothetical protein